MFAQILAEFLPTIQIIMAALILLIAAIFAKIGSGIYLNVFSLKIKFDWKIFFEGIFKGLVFTLSILSLSLVVSGAPIVLKAAGLLFAEGATVLSYSAPVAVIMVAAYKYVKEAIANYNKTLNVTQEDIDNLLKPNTLG